MGYQLKKFPSGRHRVIFGGYVINSVSPTPEFNYVVPLENLSPKSDGSQRYSLATVGFGDIPLILNGSVYDDGQEVEADLHNAHDLSLKTSNESKALPVQERRLGEILKCFVPDSDPHGYFESLEAALLAIPELNAAPLVANKLVDKNAYILCPASEWYRAIYGRKSYTAQAFLEGTHEDRVNALLVEYESIDSHSFQLTKGEQKAGAYWSIVPRKDVDDNFSHLIAYLIGDEKAAKNMGYAASMLIANASDPDSPLPWLRFGHPFPDQELLIRANGVYGTLRSNKSGKPEEHRIFFVTRLRGYAPPIEINCVIARRENEGRNATTLEEGDHSLDVVSDPDRSDAIRGKPYTPKNENGEHDTQIELDPDTNPDNESPLQTHIGSAVELIGHPTPKKMMREKRPDANTPTILHKRRPPPSIKDRQTTHKKRTEGGEAGRAGVDPPTEAENTNGFGMVLLRLIDLSKLGEIEKLQEVRFQLSRFHYQGYRLQKFGIVPRGKLRSGWDVVSGRPSRGRLLLCVRFIYKGIWFLLADPELRSPSENYKFLLLHDTRWHGENQVGFENSAKQLSQKIHNAKGIVKHIDWSESDTLMETVKHTKSKTMIGGQTYLQKKTLLNALDKMIERD